ncbi:MAG TPA: FG-GAP-like repeat-containing protein [Polyangiaceae bacterium]|nr:FG-GAP-like repeat-containing protein [Polyangiaceae bacterium]
MSACTDLPEIESGECGNGVIEDGENCDTFARNPGGVCRPRGSVGECHLDCRRVNGKVSGSCPSGWGCDSDGLCREPSGNFDEDIKLPFAGVESLAAGDFDGDGRADLVSREPTDSASQGKPTVHYFDPEGALVESLSFPKRVGTPYIGDISGDERSDFVFTTFQIGVLLGRVDRTWVPETFSSYRLPNTHVRMASVIDRGVVSGDDGIAALATLGGETGIFLPTQQGTLQLVVRLPEPVENLAEDFTTGDVVEGRWSPCREILLAFRGAETFSLYDFCDTDPVLGIPSWRSTPHEQHVTFDPPARAERGPLLADLNGDGHLDVLIGASGRVYAAYGDGQQLTTAVPYELQVQDAFWEGAEPPMPIAVGEFSGDRFPDFVFADHLLASLPGSGVESNTPAYVVTQVNAGARWTEALVADFNGNGAADILATSRDGLNLSFYNGTGTPFMNAASLSTFGPVEHLALGDFDGDLLHDVAFIEHAASTEDTDSLSISFGAPFGPPSAPVTVAHVKAAEQVMSFADSGLSSLIVASSRNHGGTLTGELALLLGSADRLPLALHTLVSLSEDGAVTSAPSVAISVGAFTGRNQHDLVSVAATETGSYEYWLIRSIDDNASAPIKLEGGVDERFGPFSAVTNGTPHVSTAGSAADLDGDGVDESIWILPAQSGSGCALFWFDVDVNRKRTLPRGTLLLEGNCDQPSLMARDMDADGAPDLILLTSRSARDGASLSVLWNERGQFDLQRMTHFAGPPRVPQAFTVLPAFDTDETARLAFVTETSAEIAGVRGRDLGNSRTVRNLERGTGIAGADFNGDGAVDLAIADAGKVVLLKGLFHAL